MGWLQGSWAARAGWHARAHEQRDVVAFEQDPSERLACLLFDAQLLRVIKDKIHVLVKANDAPLNPEVGVLIEPDLNACFLR